MIRHAEFGTEHREPEKMLCAYCLDAEIDRLRAEVIDAAALHLADEQTARNLEAIKTKLEAENAALKVSKEIIANGAADLMKENAALKDKVKLATVATKLLEDVCPCGARPESPRTHPHVTGCLVVAILNVLRE